MVIYKTINLVTGKWYIGKDAANNPNYLGSGKLLALAIKKHGKHNFQKIILEECKDRVHLCEREKYWIKFTGAVDDKLSYNLALGGDGGDLSRFIDYTKTDYSSFKMTAATAWFFSLSGEEKKVWHSRQAEKRCKGWYVSRISDQTEIYVKNIAVWCRENGVDTGTVSCLVNPKSHLFQKQSKGWRIRRSDQDPLPEYINKQKIGHANIACKGKSWKLIDGKRVWVNKEEITL